MADKWVITGAGGQLGSVLMRQLAQRGSEAVGLVSLSGPMPEGARCVRIDLGDAGAVREIVQRERPTVIVHAAAVTSIQTAYEQPELTRRVNVEATRVLVELSETLGARIAFTSTDLVFDGTAAPYCETDGATPLSVYGRSKVEAEGIVLAYSGGVVVRPALMYGVPAVKRATTFLSQAEALRSGRALTLFEDEFRTPIWLEDAATATRVAAMSDYRGILHLGGPVRMSRMEMGRVMAAALDIDAPNIVASRQAEMATAEPRPADVSLDSTSFARQFGKPPGRAMDEAMREIAGTMA